MNRENIMNALLAKLQAATGIASATRKFVIWDQVPQSEKPLLVLKQAGTQYEYTTRGTPAKATIRATLLVYTAVGQDVTIPAAQMNNILDAIDTALSPSPLNGVQNLGGLVTDCRIEGNNMEDDGALDGNGVAIRNIAIFVPVTGV